MSTFEVGGTANYANKYTNSAAVARDDVEAARYNREWLRYHPPIAFIGDGLLDLLVECFCGGGIICGQGAGAQWVLDVLSMRAGLPMHVGRYQQDAIATFDFNCTECMTSRVPRVGEVML